MGIYIGQCNQCKHQQGPESHISGIFLTAELIYIFFYLLIQACPPETVINFLWAVIVHLHFMLDQQNLRKTAAYKSFMYFHIQDFQSINGKDHQISEYNNPLFKQCYTGEEWLCVGETRDNEAAR